ncbi:MAG: NACHT domain-containing protein [Microcystis sp. LE19-131.1A]|jgi:energy-coupling factor transporter ATP-binding protein EcfA2|uniref:NACHT domain-containing protein n=2 Tax=Microcystis TaxID=1125 RepID=UPI0022BB1626|nr:NACHT domain-containing protein [Microcystis sp. LE19-131.1A]MCZ8240808.1 NACHT domain-containing protein [Microcystis sp. LE19-131.1A]
MSKNYKKVNIELDQEAKLSIFDVTQGSGSNPLMRVSSTLVLPENQRESSWWQGNFRGLVRQDLNNPPRIGDIPGQITNYSEEIQRNACQEAREEFANQSRQWLEDNLRTLKEEILDKTSDREEVIINISTDDRKFIEFPWSEWSLWEKRPQAWFALSPTTYKLPPSAKSREGKIRLLAILGGDKGIDVQKDKVFLNQLPNTDPEFLVKEPKSRFSDALWEQTWDILSFSGHSSSQGDRGSIAINDHENLNLDELRDGLKKAISRGLKLAIFNSCDGLKLAEYLQDLNIPQVIVMREPVPNGVAQDFFKYFLDAFFHQRESFYYAVRTATERINEDYNNSYPGIGWLPVVFQNPATEPLSLDTEIRYTAQNIPWQTICNDRLQLQQKLTTNPLTARKVNRKYEREEVYVPLGLLERKVIEKYPAYTQSRRERSNFNPLGGVIQAINQGIKNLNPFSKNKNQNEPISTDEPIIFKEVTTEVEVIKTYENQEFLEQVLKRCQSPKSQGKRIAIIGEPGSGKTTLLQQVGRWLGQEMPEDIPIWVSLADLQGQDLEHYLFDTWLKSVIRNINIDADFNRIESSFKQRLKAGNIWILLDGVDEMYNQSVNILRELEKQINEVSWFDNTRIILTCRLNLWDNDFNALIEFDTYKTLKFSYPEQVEEFITRWFSPYDQENNQQQGAKLINELKNEGKQHVQDLVRNPLCLTLLCWNWYHQQGQNRLPETRAGLYRQFVNSLLHWQNEGKKYRLSVTSKQLKQLNRQIGKLAQYCWDHELTRFRFHEDIVCKFLGEQGNDSSLFNLVLKLGWLNKVGEDVNNKNKNIYAFFHPSFTEYFAAVGIEDSRFFFNHISYNPNHSRASYRIFDTQWREVFLLWLGREDLAKSKKNRLINALTTFKDGWDGYYQYQAYFMAALGLTEFENPRKQKKVIKQMLRWAIFDEEYLLDNKDKYSSFRTVELSQSKDEFLQQYGFDLEESWSFDKFLGGVDSNYFYDVICKVRGKPDLWRDKLTVAHAAGRVLTELGFSLIEEEPIETPEKEIPVPVNNQAQSEWNFDDISEFIRLRSGYNYKYPSNSYKQYTKNTITEDNEESVNKTFEVLPHIVDFLKVNSLGITTKNDASLDWKKAFEYLIQLSIDHELIVESLAEVISALIPQDEKKEYNAKLQTAFKCIKEIAPIEYKVSLIAQLMIYFDDLEKIQDLIDDLKQSLQELPSLNESIKDALTDSLKEKIFKSPNTYTKYIEIYAQLLGIPAQITPIILSFTIHDIQSKNQYDKDILTVLDVLERNSSNQYFLHLIAYFKEGLINHDLEKRGYSFKQLYHYASGVSYQDFSKVFFTPSFKLSLAIQSLYMKMKRDIWLREYDRFSQLADHGVIKYSLYLKLLDLIHKIRNLITYQNNLQDYLLEFYLYILSIVEYLFFLIRLIHYAMIPFLYICQGVDWLMSFILWLFCKFTIIPIKILINTFSFSQKIQRERVYFRQLKNYWHTFDGWTQEILVNSMSHNTQNIDASDGTGAIAGFITFFLGFIVLIIPPLSELFDKFITTNLKLVIELIFYHFSNYINHPNLYLVYVQCLDALEKFLGININWWQADTITSRLTILLTKLGILLTITILFFWIINPDKLYGKIETIRNSNFKKFSGMLDFKQRLKISGKYHRDFDPISFVNFTCNHNTQSSKWNSLSQKDQWEILARALQYCKNHSGTFFLTKKFSLFCSKLNWEPISTLKLFKRIVITIFKSSILALIIFVLYFLFSDQSNYDGCNFYINRTYNISRAEVVPIIYNYISYITDQLQKLQQYCLSNPHLKNISEIDKLLIKFVGLINSTLPTKPIEPISLTVLELLKRLLIGVLLMIFMIIFYTLMIMFISWKEIITAEISKQLLKSSTKFQKIRILKFFAENYRDYRLIMKSLEIKDASQRNQMLIEGGTRYIYKKLFKDFEYLEIDQDLQKLFWQYYLSKYKKDHPELVQEIMDSFN